MENKGNHEPKNTYCQSALHPGSGIAVTLIGWNSLQFFSVSSPLLPNIGLLSSHPDGERRARALDINKLGLNPGPAMQ